MKALASENENENNEKVMGVRGYRENYGTDV